jgi:hypothetical protein
MTHDMNISPPPDELKIKRTVPQAGIGCNQKQPLSKPK